MILWLFNIGAERYWNPAPRGITDRSEDRIVSRMEEMNLLLCRPQDLLILREQPDEAFLARLRGWGFEIPRILVPAPGPDQAGIAELVLADERLLGELGDLARAEEERGGTLFFVPYAATLLEERIAERCGLALMAAPSSVGAAVNDKIANRLLAEELGLPVCAGRVCRSAEEIRSAWKELTEGEGAFRKVIIKEPHGASGKGLYLVDSPERLEPLLHRLERSAKRNTAAAWLVEGWQPKSADINFQLYVSPQGETEIFSMKEQMLRDTVYIGSRFPVEIGETAVSEYRRYGEEIGRKLHEQGYSGVAGVDSIITTDGEIIPIIEINGRFTLSTYLSFLAPILGERTKAISRYFRLSLAEPLSFGELCGKLEQEELLFDRESGEGVLVYTSGTLPVFREEGGEGCKGRLFALIAARQWSRAEELNDRLDRMLDRLEKA